MDLSGNNISDAYLRVLTTWAQVLEEKSTTVNLSNSGLNDQHTDVIAYLLQEMKTIQEVDLSGNDLHEAGVEAIAEVLKSHPTITTVNFAGNHIRYREVNSIAGAVETNQRLRTIYLAAAAVGFDGKARLRRACDVRKQHRRSLGEKYLVDFKLVGAERQTLETIS